MVRYEAGGDLASRDRVARAIVREEVRTGRPVFLSLQDMDPAYVHARFPLIAAACRRAGLDLARDPIPVGPAAHYVMGGVQTDLDGRTTLPGLYAAGEVARTGVHGANRLASNSLLEGLVFGARAGKAMRADARGARADDEGTDTGPAATRKQAPVSALMEVDTIRDLMWRNVGLFRERRALEEAVQQLEGSWRSVSAHLRDGGQLDANQWRGANLLTVARLVARAALRREESRGAHYRDDFPRRDDINWNRSVSESTHRPDPSINRSIDQSTHR
jgi:L-aspartate oxidase